MNESFSTLKGRLRLLILLRACLLGISLGVGFASIPILVYKLSFGQVNVLIPVLVGVGGFLIGFGMLILINPPTEKRIARLIDERLSLDEKVQTLIEFKEKEGEIVEVQRQEANELLRGVKVKSLLSKRIWLNFIAPVIAVALLIVTICVPAKQEYIPSEDKEPEEEQPPADVTLVQIQELKDLIKEVKASNMEKIPKEKVISELEGLLETLQKIEEAPEENPYMTEAQLKDEVKGAISNIQHILDDANSSDDISSKLDLSTNELIRRLAYRIKLLETGGADVELGSMKQTLINENDKEIIKELSNTYSSAIKKALADSEVDENNIMLLALLHLANELEVVSNMAETDSLNAMKEKIAPLFENASIDLRTAIRIQGFNRDTVESVIEALVDIFGLTEEEIPKYEDEDDTITGDIGEDEPPEENSGDAGYGSGEMQYGSKDLIYDPKTDTFVEYGTLLSAYLKEVDAQIREGKYPPEFEDFKDEYFKILSSGFEK